MLLLFFTIIVGAIARFHVSMEHFTHIDDLIVPITYNNLVNNGGVSFLDRLIFPLYVGMNSTYGPGQYIFSGWLMGLSDSYKGTLFLARLPSLFFGVLSMGFNVWAQKEMNPKGWVISSLLGVTFLSFSWFHIIYSAQSNPYAVTVLGVFLFFIILELYKKNRFQGLIESALLGVILTYVVSLNYIFTIFIPGFFLAIFYLNNFNLACFTRKNYPSIMVFGLFFLVLYKIVLSEKLGRGTNSWNQGAQSEYLFNVEKLLNGDFFYIFEFFVGNLFTQAKAFVGPVAADSLLSSAFAFLILFMTFLGFVFLFIKKRDSFYFSVFTLLIYVVLVVAGKLTMGPTRHSLFLLGFATLIGPFGFWVFYNKAFSKKPAIGRFAVLFFVFSSMAIFITGYDDVMAKRKMKFYPERIERLVKSFDVKYIISYGWTGQISIMEKDLNYTKLSGGSRHALRQTNITTTEDNVMLLTHRESWSSNKMEYLKRYAPEVVSSGYEVVHTVKDTSDSEIGFGSYTKNGSNSFIVHIINPY